jgi:hypothetical protein
VPDSAEPRFFFDTAELFQEHLGLHHPDIDQSTSAEIVHKSRQPATLPNLVFCLHHASGISCQSRASIFVSSSPRNDIKESDMVSSGRPSYQTAQTDTTAPQELDLTDAAGIHGDEHDSVAAEPQNLSVTDFAPRLSTIDHDSSLTLGDRNLAERCQSCLARVGYLCYGPAKISIQ